MNKLVVVVGLMLLLTDTVVGIRVIHDGTPILTHVVAMRYIGNGSSCPVCWKCHRISCGYIVDRLHIIHPKYSRIILVFCATRHFRFTYGNVISFYLSTPTLELTIWLYRFTDYG